MASLHNAILFINIALVLGFQTAMSFRIEISPKRYTEESTGVVKINCVVETLDECVNRDVLLLELRKDGQDLVASVRLRSGFRYGSNFPNKYQGQGSVENNHNNRSFLNVSVLAPDSDDGGVYTCSMYFFNEAGDLKEDHASKNLTVEIINVHTTLRTLVATVSSLENELKVQDNELQSAVKDLKKLTERHNNHSEQMLSELARKDSELQELRTQFHNHSLQLPDLAQSLEAAVDEIHMLTDQARNQSNAMIDFTHKVNYTSYFSASLKSDINLVKDNTVLFNDVIINERKDYDETTGIFTVPWDGLYAFNLAARANCAKCDLRLLIKANDVIMASLYAYSSGGDQSSTSCIRQLAKGDKVKVVVFDNTAEMSAWHRMTMFSGYLVRPLI